MRYDDLIYDPLNEAQLSPGQVKSIKLKINDYEQELEKLRKQQYALDDRFKYGDFPKELQDKIDAYVAAYTKAIDELKDKLKQSNTNPQFDNFIAGIKKNCSEIVDAYKIRGKVFYAGFKNTTGQHALYAKPPSRLNLGEYYPHKQGEEIQDLIEMLYDNMSFENAVFASSDSYDMIHDNRTPYIIFPRNGFKYFWSQEQFEMAISHPQSWRLFDKDTLEDAYKVFVEDPAMLEKFRAAGAELPYTEKEYIGAGDGFMGKYYWESQIRALDRMHEQGTLPDGWDRMIRWTSWVSRQSFQEYFEMRTDGLSSLLGYGHHCIINTSGLYAFHSKYRKQVFAALGIGNL